MTPVAVRIQGWVDGLPYDDVAAEVVANVRRIGRPRVLWLSAAPGSLQWTVTRPRRRRLAGWLRVRVVHPEGEHPEWLAVDLLGAVEQATDPAPPEGLFDTPESWRRAVAEERARRAALDEKNIPDSRRKR